MKDFLWTILIIGVFIFSANHFMKVYDLSLWIFPL